MEFRENRRGNGWGKLVEPKTSEKTDCENFRTCQENFTFSHTSINFLKMPQLTKQVNTSLSVARSSKGFSECRKRPLRVLIACERSQVEQAAFAARGADAWSLDIAPCYGPHPERHIIADAYDFNLSGWDLIVAHPPCTYLTHANNARRGDPGQLDKAVHALRLWARFLFESPCPVAVENSVGIPSEILSPDQIVCPSMFGDSYRKRTCLWLRGLPPLLATIVTANPLPWIDGGRGRPGVASKVCGVPRSLRSRARSQSFPGFAAAMADQWLSFLEVRRYV